MAGYVTRRLLRGLLSVAVLVTLIMAVVYGLLDRNLIFADDPVYNRQQHNARQVYKLQQWEKFGFVFYVTYGQYLQQQGLQGAAIGDTAGADSEETAQQVAAFTKEYTQKGYTVERLDAVYRGGTKKYQDGGEPRLYAYRDVPLGTRLWRFFRDLIQIDGTWKIKEIPKDQRDLDFTLFDPAYGGDTFAPAILGTGSYHRYLMYVDGEFPFVHQNVIKLNLGVSYSVNAGVDVVSTLKDAQGAYDYRDVTYPTGLQEKSADDLHSAVYVSGSLDGGTEAVRQRFVDNYTGVTPRRSGLSRVGYSFVIGILAVVLSYLVAIPVATGMAMRQGGLADRLGTWYIMVILAVPSLGYIFLVKAIGGWFGLPGVFDIQTPSTWMYVLPVISLALPAIANLMKWLRRYTVDQLSADYVRFAKASGLPKWRIMGQHVLRNAVIPLLHGLPGSILGALVGAIITERVYVVPGAGNLLTRAINRYDNGVIVALAAFYAALGVVSVIAGDLLMAAADPRVKLGDEG